jgi:SAM-dependent methyltransferase
LAFDDIHVGSATAIPVADNQFDLVFSHGVLHHVPDIETAQREIHRVLRPGGRLVVMLYARHSLNYQLSIRVVRRAALLGAWPVRRHIRPGMLADHLANAEREGLFNYLRMTRFVHASTDGPANPHARVYDLADVRRDFSLFKVVRAHQHYMHAPPLPVHGLPGGGLLGWHLWVELEARQS